MEKLNLPPELPPKIIRAWFDTVLNPILRGLISCKERINRDDYPWDFHYNKFKEIKTFELLYNKKKYNSNFNQLVGLIFPELKKLNIEYDQKLKDFNDSCFKLFRKLVSSPELKNLIFGKIDEYKKLEKLSEDDAIYLKREDGIKWIAEDLINNKRILPYNHVFKIIWDSEADKFFDILSLPDIKDAVKDKNFRRNEFERAIVDAIDLIYNFSNKLSINYGEPIAI